MKKLLLIDTFNFLHRAYHALPKTFTDKNGEPINAVYGVTSMLISVFDQIKPDFAVATLDDRAPTMRHEDFTGYKAHRRPMEDELSSQISKVFEIIDAFGIKKISVPGYEADDIIGTLVERNKDLEVVIVSNDRDLWQLVGKHVLVMNPTTKGQTDWIGEEEVMARQGLTPDQVADYKGLRGDPSDNIPGVYGIGEKTAQKLISEYGSIDNLYKNIDKVTPESLRMKLAQSYEQAIMSRNLARIVKDAPFEIKMDECEYSSFDLKEVKDVLEKYNFKSLLKRLGFDTGDSVKEKKKSDVPDGQMSLL